MRHVLRPDSRPRDPFATDGRVWYVDHDGGMFGTYSPLTEGFIQWPLPGGAGSESYALAVDDADRQWIVETGTVPNRFVDFDAATETFLEGTEVPSDGGSMHHMQLHAASVAIWIGADRDTVGRFMPVPRQAPLSEDPFDARVPPAV